MSSIGDSQDTQSYQGSSEDELEASQEQLEALEEVFIHFKLSFQPVLM
jgi:hypothetical protein